MSIETATALLLPAVSAILCFVTARLAFPKWEGLRQRRYRIEMAMVLCFLASASVPFVLLWSIGFLGWLLHEPGALAYPLKEALAQTVRIYGFAVLGCPRILWFLLVPATAGVWGLSIATKKKAIFVVAQSIAFGISCFPPVLLFVGIIPYIGP